MTFSEAVTVTGTPRVTLDIGGQPRYAKYTGAGSATGQILFGYTVLIGDGDTDGVALQANSLALNGGAIQATDDSTGATLTHAAMTFANHNVDTEVLLVSNLDQEDASSPITVSATQSASMTIMAPDAKKGMTINAITLDVKTPSDTLDVTIRVASQNSSYLSYTYTGSVSTAGLQTFTLSSPAEAKYGAFLAPLETESSFLFDVSVHGSGTGSIQLEATSDHVADTGAAAGWGIGNPIFDNPGGFVPQVQVRGYTGAIPYVFYSRVISSPMDGSAYAAGERIEIQVLFSRIVKIPTDPVVPFWLGNGAQHRREATLVRLLGKASKEGGGVVGGFIAAYTVQPDDRDTDGIYIGANPLGDRCWCGILCRGRHPNLSASLPRCPGRLVTAGKPTGTNHAVDGSRTYGCQEVLCSTMVVGVQGRDDPDEEVIGYGLGSVNIAPVFPYYGALSSSIFSYGGEEWVIWNLVQTERRTGVGGVGVAGVNALQMVVETYLIDSPLPQEAIDRLVLSVAGEKFPLNGEDVSFFGYYFTWDEPDLTWAENDEIDIELIEAPVTATFDAASYSGYEGDTVDVTVTLGGSFETRTVTLPIKAAGSGSATDSDYSGVPENLVFAPGETEKSFTTVTLTDDDVDDVSFGAATYTAAEGSTATVTVSLSADPERTVTVPLTKTEQGGATSADYSGVPASVTFDAGQTSKTITFTAVQDTVDDDDESVNLAFGILPSRVSAGTRDETTVSITDDDDPQVTVSFGASTYTAAEGGTATVTLTLSANPERTVEVPITKTEQGGATSADYSGVPATVTFNSGDTSKTITFSATQDTLDDDGESVELAFGALPTGVTAGATDETTVSITDDDDPQVTVSFGASTYTAVEGGTATVTVELSADPERTVEVPITAANQGGASAADYSGVPATVTFDAGDKSKTFDFAATQDAEDDDGESVKLAFGALPTGVTAGATDETSVSITDDDDPQVTVSFGARTYTAAEGGTATVTVTLSADPERTVEVQITTTNQGGASAADYSGVPATVTFNAGETSQPITFAATQDTEDDDGESVLLAFGALPTGVTAGATAETTVSITDDDDPAVTVSFGAATYTAAEGGTATVRVTLSADPERTVEVQITTTNQGGASAADYSGVPATVTFNAGETSQPITFAATQDAEDDDGESVKLAFGALPTGVTAGATDETTVSISDDDDPAVTVSFGAATYTAAEGGTATVTVTLSADPERTVEVQITTTNQGGASAADYSGVPTSVTFDAGDTSKTFDFAATQDAEDDDGESVDLAFGTSLPAGVSAGSPSETTVSITDDDDPQVTVSFGAATYRAIEGSTAAVTVELSADPERTVEVPITKTNERGVSDSDYSGVPASITFNSGDTEKTISFTATADSLNESGERVKLSFGTLPAGVSEGTPAETTVTISDSTQAQTTLPTIHFGGASYTVSEGGSVDVTVTLSKAPGSEAVIPLTASNQGGATASDYSGVPTSVTFGAAETSKTFTVTAAQDTVDDDGESILLGFGTLPGGITATTGQAAATTVSITDDDDPQVTVSFGAATYTAAEGSTATVTVTLSADPERTVAIPVTKTNQGGATSADYSGVPTSVTFDTGDTSKTFDFAATADTVDDDGESVKLAFGTSLPVGVSAGSPSETTVSITDDDDPQVTVSFGAATYRAIEGGTATVTVELSADPERTVAIPLIKANEGGASASDYSGVPASITFNSGDTEKTITFTAVQDSLNESGERVKLSFGTLPARVSEGTPDETTVSISDSVQGQRTPPTVHFGAATYTVAEGGGVAVAVTLSKAPGSEAVIPITTTNQGGTSAADYSGVPASVSFGAAETSKTITFAAAQDTADDDGESVLLGFGTLPGGITATTGEAADTTVSITDDDDPQVTVSFGASTYTAAEGGTATVTVTLSADPERTVAIPLTKANEGGATSADYSGVPATVTFNAGETSQPITFAATQDAEDDDGESVKLAFGALPTGVRAGATAETTVSITDDDDPAVTVSFGAATYTAAEGGTATVTVTLSADPERTVEVQITTTNQGGAVAADYSGVPATVTFNAGETSQPITFAATQDAEDDDGESVKLAFGALPTGVTAGSPSETTVSITDNDDPAVTVSFGAATYTAAEGGTATVTVTLSADPERTVEVQLTTTNQGGASSADYSGVAGHGHVQRRGDVQDLRLRGDPGRGGRRWGEREAGVRRAAHRGEGGGDRRDDGEHHRRRRPGGDGVVRRGHLYGGGGGHGHGDGDAERGPGADGRGPDHHDEPGRRDLCRLLRRAGQRHLRRRGHVQDLRLRGDPGRGGRRRGERGSGLRDEPADGGERGLSQRNHGEHHR